MLDEHGLQHLLEESQDLHADAMRQVGPAMADLADLHHGSDPPMLDEATARQVTEDRRDLLARTSKMLAAGGLLSTGVGAGLISVLATPAYADKPTDIQMLQTATSLELLAVATYEAALGLPFISGGNAVVKKFAETTKTQHAEHGKSFAAQTKTLGGKEQTSPNAKYLAVVESTKPTLKAPADVVKLAMALEQVATETYLKDTTVLDDADSKALFASVMGVECQHLAVLRAVDALLAAGDAGAALIAIPTDAAALPAAAGSVAFPEAIPGVGMASPPAEGAVK
jgi:rubrerythrin